MSFEFKHQSVNYKRSKNYLNFCHCCLSFCNHTLLIISVLLNSELGFKDTQKQQGNLGSISSMGLHAAFTPQRSQKRKKLLNMPVFSALLGSSLVKAACKMLVKLTPDTIRSCNDAIYSVLFNFRNVDILANCYICVPLFCVLLFEPFFLQ